MDERPLSLLVGRVYSSLHYSIIIFYYLRLSLLLGIIVATGVLAEALEKYRLPLRIIFPDNMRVLAQRAEAKDRDKLIAFYESLTPETIYYRFLHMVRDFSKYADLALGPLNKYGVVVLGFDEARPGKPIASAEVFSKEGSVGEIAITVHENYRGRGLGTIMTIIAVLEAYRNGVKRIEAYVLTENTAAIKIAKKVGISLNYAGGGAYRAIADVEKVAPRALSLFLKVRVEPLKPTPP